MVAEAARLTEHDLPALANVCHDQAESYLVRFIAAQDEHDAAAAAEAWQRYQWYCEAESQASVEDLQAGRLPVALQRVLDNPATAREVQQALAAQ